MFFPKFLKIAVLLGGKDLKSNITNPLRKVMLQYVTILSQRFGFFYEFIKSSDGEIGRPLPNGSWTGLVGMLQSAEADVCLYLGMSEERLKVLNYTYPFSIARITFLTRKPEHIPETATFLKPFSLYVWVTFCSCLILMVFILGVLLRKKYSFINLFMYVYAIVARQTLRICPRRLTDFVLVSGLIIGITFFVHSYTAVLLSFLTIPPLSGVRTIPELAKAVSEGNYYCASYPGSYFSRVLLNSDNSNLRIIGENMKRSKGVSNVDELLSEIQTRQKAAFVGGLQAFSHLTWKYFASEDSFFLIQIGIAMRKDFCCKDEFEKSVRYFWYSGINKKIEETAAFELQDLFSAPLEKNEDMRPLSMKDFKAIFYFMIAGHILSAAVLLFEIIIGMYDNHRNVSLI